jgi:hypothetical protein
MLLKYYWKNGLIVFVHFLWAIALSVLRFTASDYTFGIFWPLHCLSFDLRLLITPLVSFGHCIVCPSIYGFWLHLWYLLAIALSFLRFTASDYTFGIFWPFHCLSFDLRLLITPLVSFGHCIVCPSIYGFWLHLWYLHTFLMLTSNHKSDIIVLLVTLTSNHKSDIIVLLVTLTSSHKSDIIVLLVTLTFNHKSDIIVLLVTLTSDHRPDITVFNNRFVISVRAWSTPLLNKSSSQEMAKWLRQVTVDTSN